jgi:hypothetical protein
LEITIRSEKETFNPFFFDEFDEPLKFKNIKFSILSGEISKFENVLKNNLSPIRSLTFDFTMRE